MGGRGAGSSSASNPYLYWDRGAISREMGKCASEINKKRIAATLNVDSSKAVRRKVISAQKAIRELDKKYLLLEKALKSPRTKNNLF